MIIESLKINNYRVFAGEHDFDLSPRVKYGVKRPIILFGGLNGAGKTSILSAIRLALYGKQSLGLGITQKAYEEHLSSQIHRSANMPVNTNHASVRLCFTYAKLGERFAYKITRNWTRNGKNIKESISISENDKPLDNLSHEQCQGFLNELIPIGLSNLFFFDGEKIAELAEDTKGDALGYAIKRLIGLDLFDVLSNDLGIVIRNNQSELAPKDKSKKIKALEKELQALENNILKNSDEYNATRSNREICKSELEKAENEFRAKGGAWADSYEDEKQKLNQLIGEKKALEASIREQLSGDFPFGLTPNYNKQIKDVLLKEKNESSKKQVASFVDDNKKALLKLFSNKKLTKASSEKFLEALSGYVVSESSEKLLHNLSDAAYYQIINKLNSAEENYQQTYKNLASLNRLNEQSDQIGENLARAPSMDSIQRDFDTITELRTEESKLKVKVVSIAEKQKQLVQKKLTLLRMLDELTEKGFTSEQQDRSTELAIRARGLLKNFGSKMAKSKVEDLENEFIKSFERLARKDDIQLKAKINPQTFAVEIIRDDNHLVDKNELSAGEKQIYAISILEALARTSGRKLPIIIDTPLGRLDSKHRTKLVKNYFPNASHQVIILSTDTEVDEAFYKDLSKHISHAYRLEYDPKTASTQEIEGYFWRNKELFKEVV
ncbi:DNA sulfur modification protein DndD [Aliikangiella sp. IMCC44359]|uniref:DNA sulfur modification protein DndD n=1 Tax=Aliikangiella sp. IMCC44359 TaxID=3459125 RepID=UPI00403A91EA